MQQKCFPQRGSSWLAGNVDAIRLKERAGEGGEGREGRSLWVLKQSAPDEEWELSDQGRVFHIIRSNYCQQTMSVFKTSSTNITTQQAELILISPASCFKKCFTLFLLLRCKIKRKELLQTKTSQPPDSTLLSQQAAVRSTKLELKHGLAWIKYLIIGVLISDQFPS